MQEHIHAQVQLTRLNNKQRLQIPQIVLFIGLTLKTYMVYTREICTLRALVCNGIIAAIQFLYGRKFLRGSFFTDRLSSTLIFVFTDTHNRDYVHI